MVTSARPPRRSPDGLSTPANWRDRAACLGMDTEIFFPLGSTGRAAEQTAKAKAICAGCKVREQCLECALDEPAGVWGGKTEEERQALRRSCQRHRKTSR